MSPHQVVAGALVAVGVAAFLLSVASLLALPGPLSKVHALTPASTLGGPAIALAVAVEQGIGRSTVKFVAIAIFMAVGGTAATLSTGFLAQSKRTGNRRTGGAGDA